MSNRCTFECGADAVTLLAAGFANGGVTFDRQGKVIKVPPGTHVSASRKAKIKRTKTGEFQFDRPTVVHAAGHTIALGYHPHSQQVERARHQAAEVTSVL